MQRRPLKLQEEIKLRGRPKRRPVRAEGSRTAMSATPFAAEFDGRGCGSTQHEQAFATAIAINCVARVASSEDDEVVMTPEEPITDFVDVRQTSLHCRCPPPRTVRRTSFTTRWTYRVWLIAVTDTHWWRESCPNAIFSQSGPWPNPVLGLESFLSFSGGAQLIPIRSLGADRVYVVSMLPGGHLYLNSIRNYCCTAPLRAASSLSRGSSRRAPPCRRWA